MRGSLEREVFRRAKNTLQRRGWRQGGGDESGQPVCLSVACTTSGLYATTALVQLIRFLELVPDASIEKHLDSGGLLESHEGHTRLHQWNDTPGRTGGEVVALLDHMLSEDIAFRWAVGE